MFAEEKPFLQPLPLEPFRYYQYGERTVHLDGCVEVEAAYYSAPPGWIGRRSRCSGTRCRAAARSPHRSVAARASAAAARRVIASTTRTVRAHAAAVAATAGPCAKAGANIGASANAMHCSPGRDSGCAASWAFFDWSRSMAALGCDDACAAALELRVPEYHFVRRYLERSPQAASDLRQVDPLIRQLTLYRDLIQQRTTRGDQRMNLIELQRSLRQLRLGGMAAVLETRLRQAQAEPMAPIDLISCLVSDELTRAATGCWSAAANRPASATPNKTLDNFDFTFNPKMNRSLVFDLATGAFIDKREDALVSRPRRNGQEPPGAGHRPGRHSAGLQRALSRNARPAR